MELNVNRLQGVSKFLFPALTGVFLAIYVLERELYHLVLQEDHLIEWLTFLFLMLAGFTSLYLTTQIKRRYEYWHWFFLLFFAFNILAAFEEISWGQRVFDWETTGIFAAYSDQNETNLHNTVQGAFHVKTKHIALVVLAVYGLVLPWVAAISSVKRFFEAYKQVIIPPKFLSIGFLFASLMVLDEPTGMEEEIGEFFYSSCFLLLVLYNYCLFRTSGAFGRPN